MKKMFCVFLAVLMLAAIGAAFSQADYEALAAEVTIDKVFEAQDILSGVAQKTPLIASPKASVDAEVYLKLENLQTTGSFKLRGAYYAISRLTPEQKAKGVVTCSAGNHAQGVALAAREFGIDAAIFIPASAPKEKVEATKAYGVNVRVEGENFDEAKAAAEKYVEETGGVYVPPYDDANVIAGQGTIAWEILEDLPGIEAVVVPIGGGGLMSGISYTIKTLKPSCMVYGVEVEGMNSMQLSLEAGEPVATGERGTLADGIAVSAPSGLTFAVCQKYVDEIVTVSEEDIARAMLFMLDEHKLVAEGAGAVSIAAVLNGSLPIDGKKTVCVISGGNLDDETLVALIEGKAK